MGFMRVGQVKLRYKRGSAVQTILIIAAIAWVMGRRR